MSEKKFESKLDNIDISIFTEMSMLANQYKAINLSQGFPEFDTPEFLKESVITFVQQGKNQYAPSTGMPDLLEQISELIQRQYNITLNANETITVTSGATEALWVAIQTLVRPNDEVIVFDPAYDSYEPAVALAGGRCIHIPMLAPDYKIDWQQVEAAITAKTKAIIINSPHNPTGTLLTEQDMQTVEKLVWENDLYLISDEVYEFITFDGRQHESVLRFPKLFERSLVISSFGKTFHCTGWKLGYCTAPPELTDEFRKIHQYVTFASFTPAQLGIAKMLQQAPTHITELAGFYQSKRDCLVNALQDSRFKLLNSQGTYFLLVDYSEISQQSDRAFCHWLTKEKGVAAIPLSPFYEKPTSDKIVRLCFAKNENTLLNAAEKLCQL
ncbi:methionine aminotransferase [Aliikangiella sp. IMCC44359]|uniref:methionine aminotransferase n=1 Tax=Aliikangiella sp. IMCC44359 TaxID=3459125 RepID=UPI00403ADB40